MSEFQCPYCQSLIPISNYTMSDRYPSFDSDRNINTGLSFSDYPSKESSMDASTLKLTYYKCQCGQYTILAEGIGASVRDVNTIIRPTSLAKHFPDYIPEAIRNDYEEAYAIVNLSPKASATLARRCLQGMICDFWNIRENNLAKSIEKVKDKVPAMQWEAIDSVRKIGNIGAHMEKDINFVIDIDSDEAQKLLQLIETLLKIWYIDRHEQEQLCRDIIAINNDKQEQRNKSE